MLMLNHSNHNGLTVVPRLHSPLLEPQDEIPKRDELTTMNYIPQRNLSDVKIYKSIVRPDPRYQKRKSALPYRISPIISSHDNLKMKQTNHCHNSANQYQTLKRYINQMISRIPQPSYKSTIPNTY